MNRLSLLLLLASFLTVGCTSRTYELPTGASNYCLSIVQRATPQYPQQAHYRLAERASGRTLATFASRIKVNERWIDHPYQRLEVGRDLKPTVAISPSGQTLLITEEYLDAVPDYGYLFVRLHPGQAPETAYLHLPVGKSKPPNPYGSHPRVTAVDDQNVSVRYENGSRTFPLQQLQTPHAMLLDAP